MLPVNPSLITHALVTALGFCVAWWIQGVRLDAAENRTQQVQNKFDTYKVEQQRLKNEAEERERKRRKESEHEYEQALSVLAQDYGAFQRCVAAGKCGGLRHVPACTGGAGLRVPAAGRLDATGADAVPAAGKPATEEEPPVITDCKTTTLMLNALQADIEKQALSSSKNALK